MRRLVQVIEEALNMSDMVDEAHIGALLSHALALAEFQAAQIPSTVARDVAGSRLSERKGTKS